MSEIYFGVLGDFVSDISGGGTPSREEPNYWNGNIPWASVKDLTSNKPSSTAESITDEGLSSSASRLVPAGTPIVATRMAVGRTAVFARDVAINQDLKAVFASPSLLDKEYLFHFLLESEQLLASKGTGSTVKGIRLDDLLQLNIAVPPLPEQKKIAEILSGIDKVIEAKKKQLQKSEFMLQATKEDLMSRSSDWQQCELGELLAFRNGLNTEKDNFGSGVPFVAYKDVHSGGIITAKCLSQKVSLSSVEEERFCLRTGDILFTRTSETPEEIGFSCVFDDRDGGAVFNGFSIRGRPMSIETIIPVFSSFYFKSESVLSQMRFLCKYTTRAGISAESLSKIKVRIPDLGTQQRIANSLIALRDLIEKLDESILALQNLKASLSEELLSGRKRVSI